jgi:hypothetical protein
VGLYASVYGINPLYNRLYLEPHITPELAGTELNYTFRNERLTIRLDSNSYAVSDKRFKVTAGKPFGFFATKGQLSYFDGSSPVAALAVRSEQLLALTNKSWGTDKMDWIQHTDKTDRKQHGGGMVSKPLLYIVYQLKPNAVYLLSVNGRTVEKLRSDGKGHLAVSRRVSAVSERINISHEN